MTMDDEELIKEFIRAERRENGIEITVCEIKWPTPSEPVSHWTVVTQLPLDASEAQIDTAVRSVLDGPRFFSVCATCRERNPNGWMHDAEVCQGCSGAVY